MRRKSKKMDLYEYILEEIAQELGITPARVRQILCEAIAKVRHNPDHIEVLREYMAWSRERRQAEGFVVRNGVKIK